jgi:hypothetical protein
MQKHQELILMTKKSSLWESGHEDVFIVLNLFG